MSLFFPMLTRQGAYPVKNDGSYYGYAHYRSHIAIDCSRRCVYCDSHEDEVGGAEAMQLDHFRPESFPEFLDRANDPLNLHYACARCNLWKSDNWPARGTALTHNGTDGWVDPFAEDRLTYFSIKSDGQIEPLRHPATYIIGLLHLRREFLRKLREKRLLMAAWQERLAQLKAELQTVIDNGQQADPNQMLEFIRASERIGSLLN
jgi:5-methylcytosine-specific restriction endonuclease McrA